MFVTIVTLRQYSVNVIGTRYHMHRRMSRCGRSGFGRSTSGQGSQSQTSFFAGSAGPVFSRTMNFPIC